MEIVLVSLELLGAQVFWWVLLAVFCYAKSTWCTKTLRISSIKSQSIRLGVQSRRDHPTELLEPVSYGLAKFRTLPPI